MNISSIKARAQELANVNKSYLVRLSLILGAIALIPSIFNGEGLMSFINLILTILLLTLGHGYIVASLKICENREQELSDDDTFVGFYRFKDLFGTYFLRYIFVAVVMLVIVAIMALVVYLFYGSTFKQIASMIILMANSGVSEVQYSMLASLMGPISVMVLFFVALIAFVAILLELLTYAVPYLIENRGLKGTAAIKESMHFIKGNKWNLFKLEFSFVGWLFLQALIIGIVSALLGSFNEVIGNIVASFVGVVFGAYTFIPKYQLSKAIFFEEIAYYRYHTAQQESSEMNETEVL